MPKKWTVNIMILTALAVLYVAMGTAVYAETTGDLTETISYVLDDEGNLTITGTGAMPDYGYSGSPFYNKDNIKTIEISNGISYLGNYTFNYCYCLETVKLPASLKKIGEYCFYSCSNLKSVDIPGSVEEIGKYSFYECEKMSFVNLSDGLKKIGDYAFYGCGLNRIDIPDSVAELGESAFQSCESAKSLKLPGGIKKIPAYCFSGNGMLKKLTIPNSVEEIGKGAFSMCTDLRTITIPAGVKIIGASAFMLCYGLDSVEFKGDAPELGPQLFMIVTLTVYYPKQNKTWTADVMDSNYGGKIKWDGVCSHIAGASVTENRKEATVFAAGFYDTVVRCKDCGQEMSRKTTAIAKLKPTIKLSAKKKTLKKKKTYTLKVTGLAKGDSVKSFKSSKKGVATVTRKGKIRAIKKGKTVITVTLKSGKTAKCKIIVK